MINYMQYSLTFNFFHYPPRVSTEFVQICLTGKICINYTPCVTVALTLFLSMTKCTGFCVACLTFTNFLC